MRSSTVQPLADILIRGRCACGRRYRIRNAQAGVVVSCPECGRAIQITEADLRAAAADQAFIPLQDEPEVELREAVLLDGGQLQVAPEGSRPGIAGGVSYPHEEAALLAALGGTGTAPAPPRAGGFWASWFPGGQRVSSRRRGFVEDLLASLYFAGIRSNAMNLLLTALAIAAVQLLMSLLSVFGPLALLSLIPAVLLAVYVMQFFWSVLTNTANGEDEIPWVPEDSSVWEGAVKPALWLAVISLLCHVPAVIVRLTVPPWNPSYEVIYAAALYGGWFFWPVAVMSVAVGNSLLFLRPDWLLRCIIGIGPAYVLAWGLVSAVLYAAEYVLERAGQYMLAPLVGQFVFLYLGYVVFRTIGVLFRHHRQRLPWRF